MKRISIRKLIAGFLAVILIPAVSVPVSAEEITEKAPDAEAVGMVVPGQYELKDEGQCGDNVFYKFDNKTGVVRVTGPARHMTTALCGVRISGARSFRSTGMSIR